MRERKKLFRLLCVAVVVLVPLTMLVGKGPATTSEASSAAKIVQPHQSNPQGVRLEPAIDGSKNPELIPDRAALRSLLLAISVPPNPDQEETARLRMRVGRMNLDESDIGVLVQELGRFHGLVTAQRARIDQSRATAKLVSNPAALRWFMDEDNELNTLAEDAYDNLLRELSAEGSTKLREHLDYVKTKIKIYPPPDMSGHIH